jgi:hypothetical protein
MIDLYIRSIQYLDTLIPIHFESDVRIRWEKVLHIKPFAIEMMEPTAQFTGADTLSNSFSCALTGL